MIGEEIVSRARMQIGKKIVYGLGMGDVTVHDDSPADEFNRCDCSAFVCWCLKLNKRQPFRWLKDINSGWYNTAGIWWDAVMERTGFFTVIARPEPGNVIVYPPHSLVLYAIGKGFVMSTIDYPEIGHVGIISEVTEDDRVNKVIHCSLGNFTKYKDAVAETAPTAFEKVAVVSAVRNVRFA